MNEFNKGTRAIEVTGKASGEQETFPIVDKKVRHKILSDIEIMLNCSPFTCLFLLQAAKAHKRHLNPFINSILKNYLHQKDQDIRPPELSSTLSKAVFAEKTSQIKIHLYQSVLKELLSLGQGLVQTEVEIAINNYVLCALSKETAINDTTRTIIAEALRCIEGLKQNAD